MIYFYYWGHSSVRLERPPVTRKVGGSSPLGPAQMKTSNQEIAHLLRSVAAVYMLQNANRFRIIAYERAADAVEQLNREIIDIWESDQLSTVSGIGPSIAQHLDEFFRIGDKSYLIKTKNKIPSTVFTLMRIPGLGPKKAYKLVKELKLSDENSAIDDLLLKAERHQIAKLDTFGEKSEKDIIEAIGLYEKGNYAEKRMPLPSAYQLAVEIKKYLLKNNFVRQVDALGSLARMVSTIGDVDLGTIADKKNFKKVIDYFVAYPNTVNVDNKGGEKASIVVGNGRRVDIRLSEPDNYGSMLQYFTGSKAHNIKLREYALKKGYSLSEHGIKKTQSSNVKSQNHKLNLKTFKTEEELYEFLGLQYIPPEIREGTNEIDLARQNKIPKLIELADIKGEFHVHSSYNLQPSHDLGVNTYAEVLQKAQRLKYEFIAFSDHNPKMSGFNSSDIVSIMEKRRIFIAKILAKHSQSCKYFVSCEVDILPDGRLAIPEKALDYVDLIIVSVHSSFRLARDIMTKRILRALTYPKVKILGHPTGRLLQRRSEIDVDWPAVFKECAKRDIALEINAYPDRLDLPDTLVREAKSYGCRFVIDSDAHEISQMDLIFYGVSVARRGWLEKTDVINSYNIDKIVKWLNVS